MTMRWVVQFLLLCSLVLLSGSAIAQPSDADVAPIRGNDLIRDVFGVDTSSVGAAVTSANGTGSTTVLASVSSVVNNAALIALVVMVLLTLLNGSIATARTGKVFGQRYDAMWVPLRMVIALGMLTPLASGYSLIQVGVIALGSLGSNLADQAWLRAGSFVWENQTVNASPITADTRKLVAAVYASEVCREAVSARAGQANSASGGTMSYGVWYPQTNRVQELPASHEFKVADLAFRSLLSSIPGGVAHTWGREKSVTMVSAMEWSGSGALAREGAVCGRITVTADALDNAASKAQAARFVEHHVQNLQQMRYAITTVARADVQGSLNAGQVRAALANIERVFSSNEVYRKRVQLSEMKGGVIARIEQQLNRAQGAGWVAAGGSYMLFANATAVVQEMANTTVEVTGPKVERLGNIDSTADVVPKIQRANRAFGTGAGSETPHGELVVSGSEDAPGADEEGAWWSGEVMRRAMETLFEKYRDAMTSLTTDGIGYFVRKVGGGSGDVLVTLAELGHIMIGVGVALWAAAMSTVLFTGPIAIAIIVLNGILTTPLFIIGGFFAYVLPIMPYLIWMMGVAGWLLILLLGVVAAPFWAVAHANPDGDGWAGDRARAGYMMVLSLVARPVMMVVGLMGAILVLNTAGKVVASTLNWAMQALHVNATYGAIGGFAALLIFFGLMFTLARWSFSLIHVVPDRALKAIGGPEEGLSEGSNAREASTVLVGVGSKAANIAPSTAPGKPGNSAALAARVRPA